MKLEKRVLTKRTGIIIALLCLLALCGFFIVKNNTAKRNLPITNSNQNNNSYVPQSSTSSSSLPDVKDVFIPPRPPENTSYINPTANTTVQWNGEPKKITNLNLVLGYVDYYLSGMGTGLTDQDLSYYELGKHGTNTIILVIAPAVDPSGQALLFFEKTPAGKYIFMQRMSTYSIYGYGSLGYASGVGDAGTSLGTGYALSSAKITEADTVTFYYELVGPQVINYKGLTLEQNYLYPSDLFSNYIGQQYNAGSITSTKVASLNVGDLYLYQQPSPPQGENIDPVNFYIRKYILRLPSGLYTTYYTLPSFIPKTYAPANITWNDGTKNTYFFDPGAGLGGCGNPGSYVVPVDDISQKIQPAGVADNGETIYEFKNVSDPVLLYFYHYWRGINYSSYPETVSVATWYADHSVIVYKNALGDNTILLNEKYGMTDGCGKPVIYLYPEKPTKVSVKVGATITTSEPLYGNGWQVLANPDGTLKTADNATYSSLFWEGTGFGNYPTIDKGFVVPQANLVSALNTQLKQLGLNEKESADFLEFWLPKMPSTPYVRLTWFTTSQMNELAPLVIWPRPTTTIRIFLDFQGLENNISLPKQQLSSISRKGFTVVEWGGLLRK